VLLQATAVFIAFLQGVLHTTVPDGRDWLLITGCSLAPLLVIELTKALQRVIRKARAPGLTERKGTIIV